MNQIIKKTSALAMVAAIMLSMSTIVAPSVSAKPAIVWNYSTCLTRRPILSMTTNATHPCVRILQRKLNNFYHVSPQLVVDGVFGQKTKKAVKQFQTLKNITVDGIVGSQTWDALLADYTPGD